MRFKKLTDDLKSKELPADIVDKLNERIEILNACYHTDKDFARTLRKCQSSILNTLEKELKMVPKNHYQTQWMGMGMVVFVMPIVIALSAGIDNYGMIGAGIAIGIGIGLAVGMEMDRKAKDQGRQLNFLL
ncbi:MAG: hypothetical protein HKP53_09415 [Eudoraea sp.]|nr:hypothetical protein [Eudoraea sp.]